MADYVVTDMDKWVTDMRGDLIPLLLKEGGRLEGMDKAKFNRIKNRLEAISRSTKTNDKLAQWDFLQEELKDVFKQANEKVKDFDDQLLKFKADPNFPGLDSKDQDKYNFFSKIKKFSDSMPAAEDEKFSNLTPEDAFGTESSKPYDNAQMEHLANEYGYNYKDKEERADFLKQVGNVVQQKNLEDIWNDDVYVGAVMPVTKEYAKNNYQDIDTSSEGAMLGDLAAPVLADATTNVAMFGIPSKIVGAGTKAAFNKALPTAGKMVADNFVPPVIRQGSNILLNDKDLKDATIDAVNEAATNYATPYGLRRGWRWIDRTLPAGEIRQGAKDIVDEAANKVRDIRKAMDEGAVFRTIKRDKLGNPTGYTYAKLDSKGNIAQISNEEGAKARYVLGPNDQRTYLEYRDLVRTGKLGNKNKAMAENTAKLKGAQGPAKFQKNLDEGNPRFADMNTHEVAQAANIRPQERFWNWAKNVPAVEDIQSYVTNMQGQSKWGGGAVRGILSVGGEPGQLAAEWLNTDPKLTKKDLEELNMFQKLRELHKAKPKLFKAPKIPEKYKKFFSKEHANEFTSSDTSINRIFGE